MAKSDTFNITWADGVKIEEMIGTDAGPKEFLQKVTVDIYRGRKQVPLVYQQIYNTIVDGNLPGPGRSTRPVRSRSYSCSTSKAVRLSSVPPALASRRLSA